MMYGNDKTIEILRGVADKTKSKIAVDLIGDEDFDAACCAARQLLDETIDAVKEGDMKWPEAIKDLADNLKAIDMPSPSATESEPVKGE